jgi:hypothetical protein
MNVWTMSFGDKTLHGVYLIPPYLQTGANLTCEMRYMMLRDCEHFEIAVPEEVLFQADGGSDEHTSRQCAGFSAHLIDLGKIKRLTLFRGQTKHAHMYEDSKGGLIKKCTLGNSRHFGTWASFTPTDLEQHVSRHMSVTYAGDYTSVKWVTAVHDWSDHYKCPTNFSGLKDSARKIEIEKGIPSVPARGALDSDSSESDDSEQEEEVATTPEPLVTSYACSSSVKPSGITFGSGWRVADKMKIFKYTPTFPSKMLPHNEQGVLDAKLGIETCRKIIEASNEADPEYYFLERSPADWRPESEIKAEKLEELEKFWLPSDVTDTPPGFVAKIDGFPATASSAGAIAAAGADKLAKADVAPKRMHCGSSSSRPRPCMVAEIDHLLL